MAQLQDFGSEIRIYRDIKREGGGGWTLKNDRGKPVKPQNRTARDELKQILSHFNIQHDNPCVIMTQDVSWSKHSKEWTVFLHRWAGNFWKILMQPQNFFSLRKQLY